MANEYKVKVGVEFNAIMTKVDSALTSLQERLKKLGSLTGAKDVTGGLSEGLQKIVNGFNELKNFTITPKNLNEFMGKLQVLEDELQKVGISAKDINEHLFDEKNQTAAQNIQRVNDEIKQLQANIDILQKKKDANNAADPFTEADAKSLENYRQQLEKAKGSLKGYNSYQGKLKNAAAQLGVTEEELTGILQLLAQAHKEAGNAAGEQAKGQAQLENSKLADTIQTQVNRYIGFSAILRYSKKYIQDLIKTYKEFDQSLVAIAAVTGQTRDQMWSNISVYNKMAQSLGTTTQEVINASKLYYQQGLTTTSVLKLTEETVKLATIAELDSADATEYLTTAMNGFKLSAEESTRVTDVWANLAAKTASDVDELAVAISKVASLAENAGMEIETASAFLNQMIETTREAPENLGTALKTIIARFQELKVSEEALSDGVDANKVERALKSAGVALRDVDGQFRDFDDVILDLSSKWNTLDRNTQRYIATIAAGSRQQSRFIAMVSDYEGLLRNVNYAYDSLGSADAQMAVFQEGLAASTNRLTAAWEGLYTSWSESATVISKLIDGAASFVSTLADLGTGVSGVIAIISVLIVRTLALALASQINAVAKEKEVKSIGGYIASSFDELAIDTAKIAAKTALVALYAAVALGIGLALYALIKYINRNKERLKQLEKEVELSNQAAAKTKDQASALGVLIDELKRVHKAGEDELETRQKIIDQFGENIEGIDILTDKYSDLVKAMEEVRIEQNNLAAAQYLDNINSEKELAVAKEIDKIQKQHKKDDENPITSNHNPYFWWIGQKVNKVANVTTVWTYKGKEYDTEEEALEAARQEAVKNYKPNKGKYNFITNSLIDSEGIKSETLDVAALISSYLESSSGDIENYFEGIERAEDGTIKSIEGFKDNFVTTIRNITTDLENTNFSDKFNALFSGSFDGLSNLDLNSLLWELGKVAGPESEFYQFIKNYVDSFKEQLQNAFDESNLNSDTQDIIKNNLSLGAQQAFISTFNSLADDPLVQKAYKDSILKFTDPSKINSALVSALGNMDEAMAQYSAMLDSQGRMKTDADVESFKALQEAIGGATSAYLDGMSVVEGYYDAMDSLSKLMKGGFSDEEFEVQIRSMAAAIADLGYATEEEALKQLQAATIRNDAGELTIQATEWIKQMADAVYAEGDASIEVIKAELLAYAARTDAAADNVIAIGKEMQAQEAAGHANSAATDALLENAYNEILALDDLETKALEAYDATEGGPGEAMKQQTEVIRRWAAQIQAGMSGAQVQALGESMKQSAREARTMAAALSIAKRSLDKAGKSAGGAAKETDKYKEALKELKEQLDDAKEAAEDYIDAILDYLAEQKEAAQEAIDAAEEALEKERSLLKIQLEAWKEYLEQRQKENQDALDLQGQAAAEYFKVEIEGIQAKIDALDKEAEAEDRILKLQKARDEYNRAQNSRTRLVLTKGAGWIFKADQKEISDARKTLNDVQREIQKAAYQDQIDELQKQAEMWQEIADGITKSAEEIAKLAAAVDKFRQGMAEGGTGYADVDAYGTAVTAQQGANDEYQRQLEEVEKWLEQADWSYQDYMDDQARQQFLQEFMDGTVGEQDLQEKVTAYLQDMLKTEAYIEEQKKLIEKIEKIEAAYELEKAQLGLTKQQLKEAKKIRKAIEKAFDPESGDLGLGKGSSYYQEVVAPLVETVQKIAEEIGRLEAGQGSGSGSGGGNGSGSSSSGGGGGNQGTTTTSPGTTPGTTPGVTPETTKEGIPIVTTTTPYECDHNWVYDSINGQNAVLRCTKCGARMTIPLGSSQSGQDFDKDHFGRKIDFPIIDEIGHLNGVGLPSMSTLSTSTPSFNKVTNNSSAMTINIGTLESSANNFDGLVADITRNSMLRQPI